MIVKKIRGQNKIGKIIVSKAEADSVRRMGVPIEKWVKNMLVMIAKKRKWKWYFNKEKT
jgi:hypothetical protein